MYDMYDIMYIYIHYYHHYYSYYHYYCYRCTYLDILCPPFYAAYRRPGYENWGLRLFLPIEAVFSIAAWQMLKQSRAIYDFSDVFREFQCIQSMDSMAI